MTPFMLSVLLLSLFMARSKAVSIVGKRLTLIAKKTVGLAIPSIASPDQFDYFRERIKRNYSLFEKLYDLRVIQNNSDTVEFNILTCPFSGTLRRYGFSDLSKYACAGDWIIAKENEDKWLFSREQTIGTGGMLCNPTYSRKK